MADLVGQCKKNSGTGPPSKENFTVREKTVLTVIVFHVAAILFFTSCITSLVKWYEKVRYKPQNRSKNNQKVDIIDVDYEVTNEQKE